MRPAALVPMSQSRNFRRSVPLARVSSAMPAPSTGFVRARRGCVPALVVPQLHDDSREQHEYDERGHRQTEPPDAEVAEGPLTALPGRGRDLESRLYSGLHGIHVRAVRAGSGQDDRVRGVLELEPRLADFQPRPLRQPEQRVRTRPFDLQPFDHRAHPGRRLTLGLVGLVALDADRFASFAQHRVAGLVYAVIVMAPDAAGLAELHERGRAGADLE